MKTNMSSFNKSKILSLFLLDMSVLKLKIMNSCKKCKTFQFLNIMSQSQPFLEKVTFSHFTTFVIFYNYYYLIQFWTTILLISNLFSNFIPYLAKTPTFYSYPKNLNLFPISPKPLLFAYCRRMWLRTGGVIWWRSSNSATA